MAAQFNSQKVHRTGFERVCRNLANNLFASSALALDEYRKITGQDAVDLVPNLTHGRSAAENDRFSRQIRRINSKSSGSRLWA